MPKKLDTTSRVIIIGNSPSILLHNYGKQIDSYDVVIRLNRCVTKGFEKFIGNKIDIWATTHGSKRFRNMADFVPENYLDIKYLWKRTLKVKPKLPKDFPEVEEHIMYKAPSNFKKYFATSSKFLGLIPISSYCLLLGNLKMFLNKPKSKLLSSGFI